ncbi:MAG: type I secretion system permease/ATPase [Parvularculaceae bacterium]
MPPEIRAGLASARPLVVQAAVFSIAVNLLLLTGPLYMMQLYDRVLASRSVATLAVITLLVVGLFAAMGVFDYVRTALLARAAARFDAEVAGRAFDAAIDASKLTAAASADAPLRDVRTLRTTLTSGVALAFLDAPFTPLFLILVFMLHWSLGLLSIVGAAMLAGLAILNERQSRRALGASLEQAAAADALAGSAIRNAAAMDAMGMRGVMRAKWRALQPASASTEAGDIMNAYSAATKAGRTLLQSLILGAGAYLAIKGQVTPGVMIAASIITARALAPVELILGQWRSIGVGLAAWRRLTGFLQAAPPSPARLSLPAPSGKLKLDRVVVQPARAKKPIVKGVSFEANPGEAVGIIGPSGAGKSTLARAIVAAERVVSGEVRLDGADLIGRDRDEVGPHIGYLPQEAELFDGTVAQNIARFTTGAGDAEIVAAAEDAGALALILGLPDGFETAVGTRGQMLSVGQRQRIGLARALFRKPALVVLDEPNANLDAEGEAALSGSILALKQRGACVIIVAHRPSAIAHVDRLLLLVDGEQRAYGPREEVLNKIAGGRVSALTPVTPIQQGARRGPGADQNVG